MPWRGHRLVNDKQRKLDVNDHLNLFIVFLYMFLLDNFSWFNKDIDISCSIPCEKRCLRGKCGQRRLRSACASAQSDQSFLSPYTIMLNQIM